MDTTEQEVELRGILESISNRFWGGWGYGTLLTADRGTIKIVGALEGHVSGTSVIVRGSYKQSNYGRQLDCSSIVVDSVSGELSVVRSWARKALKDAESDVVWIARQVPVAERWAFLADFDKLLAAGVESELAHRIATLAKSYLLLIEAKKGLMQQGFTDKEAETLCSAYGEKVMKQLEEDPYGIVIDRNLSFGRVDTVVGGRIVRNDRRRLHAAVVQALVSTMRNGHTAAAPAAIMKEAAEMASVYPDAIIAVGHPVSQVALYDGKLQLRVASWAEQDVACWVLEAMKRTK